MLVYSRIPETWIDGWMRAPKMKWQKEQGREEQAGLRNWHQKAVP